MTLSKWREQMIENVLRESYRDEESSVRKTITTTGDIQSCLNDSSVYSVRKTATSFQMQRRS